MVIHNVFRFTSPVRSVEHTTPSLLSRFGSSFAKFWTQTWCGMHGHLILLHFEPNKLSLQCGLCGYHSEGWEVGRVPPRRSAETRVHAHQTAADRRRNMHAVPSSVQRMAS
jgi:hypothetical protein